MQEFLVLSAILSWLVVIVNLLITMALVRRVLQIRNTNSDGMHQPDILDIGSQAPDFSLETLDGNTVSLDHYKNQESLMVFVSPSCTPCREHMPKLKELNMQMETNGANLLLVSVGAKEQTETFMEEFHIDSSVLLTEYGSSFASNYKIAGTPSYYLIDKKGQISAGGFLDPQWQEVISRWAN